MFVAPLVVHLCSANNFLGRLPSDSSGNGLRSLPTDVEQWRFSRNFKCVSHRLFRKRRRICTEYYFISPARCQSDKDNVRDQTAEENSEERRKVPEGADLLLKGLTEGTQVESPDPVPLPLLHKQFLDQTGYESPESQIATLRTEQTSKGLRRFRDQRRSFGQAVGPSMVPSSKRLKEQQSRKSFITKLLTFASAICIVLVLVVRMFFGGSATRSSEKMLARNEPVVHVMTEEKVESPKETVRTERRVDRDKEKEKEKGRMRRSSNNAGKEVKTKQSGGLLGHLWSSWFGTKNKADSGTQYEDADLPEEERKAAVERKQVLGHYVMEEAPAEDLVELKDKRYRTVKMRSAAAQSFTAMCAAAKSDGVDIIPISGYRSVNDQVRVFFDIKAARSQVSTDRAKVSAPPGYSEHHTGYALDLGEATSPGTHVSESFEKTAAFRWLQRNAARFHFELSFPRNNKQGVMYEPWHWRFVGDKHSLETFAPTKMPEA